MFLCGPDYVSFNPIIAAIKKIHFEKFFFQSPKLGPQIALTCIWKYFTISMWCNGTEKMDGIIQSIALN
jgi:hypothetical protein